MKPIEDGTVTFMTLGFVTICFFVEGSISTNERMLFYDIWVTRKARKTKIKYRDQISANDQRRSKKIVT